MELFYSFIALVVLLILVMWLSGAVSNVVESKGYGNTIPLIFRIISYSFAFLSAVWWVMHWVSKLKFKSIVEKDSDAYRLLSMLLIVVLVICAVLLVAFFVLYLISILLVDKNNYASKKSLKVDILLCSFLGIFGAHRFYEGKTITGIIYLLTGGCLGIGAFIDLAKMLGFDRKDADGNFIIRWDSSAPRTEDTTPAMVRDSIKEKKMPAILHIIQPDAIVYICLIVIFIVGGLSLGL